MLIIFALFAAAFLLLAIIVFRPISFFVLLGIAYLAHKNRARIFSAHGVARYAEENELRAKGLMGDRGIPLGTLENQRPAGFHKAVVQLFWLSAREACLAFLRPFPGHTPSMVRINPVHMTVIAPTNAGKGVSLVIPTLLKCPESTVVFDLKGEMYQATAAYRKKEFGHKIIILDPFKMCTEHPDCLNALDMIDKDEPADALDGCRDIGEALVVRGEEPDRHWNDSGENLIASIIVATTQFGVCDDRSLQTCRAVISDPVKLKGAIVLMKGCDKWGGIISRMGSQLTAYEGKELSGILSTCHRHLKFLDSMAVFASTERSTFDPSELKKGGIGMTVYLVIPPDRLRSLSGLVRLWLVTLLRACVRTPGHSNVRFILDEASSLGRMDILGDAVDKYRSYGVRMMFIYQSMGQLRLCWPEGGDQNLIANTTTTFFSISDVQTAEYVSKRLGKWTTVVNSGGSSQSRSRSEGVGNSSVSYGGNDNWGLHGRELATADELCQMNPRIALTFMPGMPPISTYLSRYYEKRNAVFERPRVLILSSLLFAVPVMMIVALLRRIYGW
jgi:type IV secretion system protein VirD4